MKKIFISTAILTSTLFLTSCTDVLQGGLKIDQKGISIGGKDGINITNSGISISGMGSGNGINITNSGINISGMGSGNGVNITSTGIIINTEGVQISNTGNSTQIYTTAPEDTMEIDTSIVEQDTALSGTLDESFESNQDTDTINTTQSSGSSISINGSSVQMSPR